MISPKYKEKTNETDKISEFIFVSFFEKNNNINIQKKIAGKKK
jgi:hypothetical protein